MNYPMNVSLHSDDELDRILAISGFARQLLEVLKSQGVEFNEPADGLTDEECVRVCRIIFDELYRRENLQ